MPKRRTPLEMLSAALVRAHVAAHDLVVRAGRGKYVGDRDLYKLHRALCNLSDRAKAIYGEGK